MNRLMAENWRIRGARAAAGADPRGPAWSALPGLPGLGELGRDGLPGAFFGDQQPAGQVDGHAGAAENGEDGEDDPHGRDVHVEVAGDAGGDSREHPVLDRPAQWLPVVRAGLGAGGGGSAGCWICSGCVHVFSVLPRARPVDREDPRFDPDGPLAGSGLARIAGQAASRDDGHMEEGSGAAAYVVAWLMVPAVGENSNIASKAMTDRRGIALVAGLGSLLVVVLLIASVLGAGWLGTLAWPLGISLAGIVLIWRNAPADEQATMRSLAEPLLGLTEGSQRSRIVARVSIASVLLAAGLFTVASGHATRAVLRPLGGVAL